jgi:polysaccharide lyase family 4-like protein
MRVRSVLSPVLAVVSGLSLAIACSATGRTPRSTLPRAGSPDDDGIGALARWSRGQPTDPVVCDSDGCYGGDDDNDRDLEADSDHDADASDASDEHSDAFGAAVYGGMYYGGLFYGAPYNPPPAPVQAYTPTAVVNGGVVEGTVTWKSPPRAPATLPGCGRPVPNPTLRISPTGGLRDAVVYLADIGTGKPASPLGGVIEARGCGFTPHLQVAAPIGAALLLSNGDVENRSVRIRPLGKRQWIFDQTLSTHRETAMPLLAGGFYEVSDTAHPQASGWVVVPSHPYYAVTDDNGHFRIDDVPPGTYTMVIWHEPVALGMEDDTGIALHSTTVEGKARVTVQASATTRRDIDLHD